MQHAFLLVILSLSRSALTPSQCSESAVMLTGGPVQALLHCCCVYNRMSITVKLGQMDCACLVRAETTYMAAKKQAICVTDLHDLENCCQTGRSSPHIKAKPMGWRATAEHVVGRLI